MSDDITPGQVAAPRVDAMEFYAGDDPHDHFPWTFAPYVLRREDGIVLGGISTPNGRRPDGSMHTYWHVVGDVWEPTAVMICKAVNAEAHARYGTPNPESVYDDEQPARTNESWPYASAAGPICLFCHVGNHDECLQVCWRISSSTAAHRRGDPDGPPCSCSANGHVVAAVSGGSFIQAGIDWCLIHDAVRDADVLDACEDMRSVPEYGRRECVFEPLFLNATKVVRGE